MRNEQREKEKSKGLLGSSLKKLLGTTSLVFEDPSSLEIYSKDQGEVPASLRNLLLPDSSPDVVVQPGSIQDLIATVRFATDHGIGVVPRGASTFGLGGAVPHHGGILLDFSTRREIYGLDEAQKTIRVGAGCRWSDASQFLTQYGLDLCSYPTSWFSTVGGWASTGGCGIGCTEFGSFHNLIRSITVVTPGGEIRTVSSDDSELPYFLGTEGQMGAIWDVTFQIRTKPARQIPLLLIFDSATDAIEAATELLSSFPIYHLKFLSSSRIHEINHLLHEEHPNLKREMDLIEKPSLLLCMEQREEEIRSWMKRKSLFSISDYRAHLLWRERMFPLRVKRIAPGLLASEVILPVGQVAEYAERADSLGKKFGVELATECYFLKDQTALTLPVYTFRSGGSIDEALKSSLAYVLTQLGVSMGGRPYGIGIWNTPFVKHKYGNRLSSLKDFKRTVDASSIFNPGKFFDLSFRTGVMGKLMALPLNSAFIPIWTEVIKRSINLTAKTAKSSNTHTILHHEELCSKCGSCIAVCPAYIETKDERTTARGKLQLGKMLLNGGDLTGEEANVLLLCMHCGACTDVCQSRLDLVPVWDELEKHVEQVYGRDSERVSQFVKSVEAKKIMGVPYARGAEVLIHRKSE